MRISTFFVFGFAFVLHYSMGTPLGLARVLISKTDTVELSSSIEKIPQVENEISTISISSLATKSIETTTTPSDFITSSPVLEVINATLPNIIDASTEVLIFNQTTITASNITTVDENRNETSSNRSKRSCRGFECEQMPPMPQQSPPCFGPRCGGYGCGCGFQCTIKFRPCCSPRCPQPIVPSPSLPSPPACNNPACAPSPPACNNPACASSIPTCRPSPNACPCPPQQQPDDRSVHPACECQSSCNSVPAPPPPPPSPPRCGCTPRGCGCSRPFMPSPISIHINGMNGYGGMNNMGGMNGEMDYPPAPSPIPYRNPCASCSCPAPVCRCPSACTKSAPMCGPAGCNRSPRFPDYDYSQNASPRDNDYFDYNGYRRRRSLFNIPSNLGRYPYSKS